MNYGFSNISVFLFYLGNYGYGTKRIFLDMDIIDAEEDGIHFNNLPS